MSKQKHPKKHEKQEKQKKQNTENLSPQKKRVFTFVLILTPVVLLILLELILRAFNYGGNLDLFVTGSEPQISHYSMCNPDVGHRFFYMQNTVPAPSKDLFLKQKPENGYRIFILGGSTAAGFPYGDNLAFSRILGVRLQDAFPDKHIEVVNTAMSAVNSYTLVDYMDDILRQEPDALLIYAGHNEFYGAMGVGSVESFGSNPSTVRFYLKLKQFKIFLLVRDAIGKIKKAVSKMQHGGTQVDPSHTLMARIVSEQTIPYKSKLYNRGLRQFSDNLKTIYRKAEKADVPVLISELVSNIKDQPPFISVKADTFPKADKAFRIGKRLLKQGDIDDAKVALTLAKDLDALRFRATEDFNAIIHETAKEFDAPVVPMKNIFESHSKQGIVGKELVLEHLHPNIDGYFRMADAFLHSMRKHTFVSNSWPTDDIKPSSFYQQDWGITELDTASANLSIHYLKGGWPFQPKDVPNHALQNYHPTTKAESLSVRILTDPDYSLQVGHYNLGGYYENTGDYEKAFKEFRALYYTIPFELEFYERAAENLMRMNDYDRSLTVLQKGLYYGETPFLVKWTGQLLARKNQFKEAAPYLEKAKSQTPDDVTILKSLALVYQKLGQTEKAKAAAEELQQLTSTTTSDRSGQRQQEPISDETKKKITYNALMQQAQKLMNQKEYKKAYPLLVRCESLHSTPRTQKWAGLLALKFGHLQQGVDFLEKAIQSTPDDFELYYNLCNGYITMGDKENAERILSRMEKLRPGFDDPHNLRKRVKELE